MIKIFGEEAKKIQAGQIFKARLDSVEGGDIAILEPQTNCDKCKAILKHTLMPYDEYELLCPYCDMGFTDPRTITENTQGLINKELLLD